MIKKDLEEREKYLKEFYPYLLEHYKFLFDKRIIDYPKKFEFMLILTNLLIIIYFGIFGNFLNKSLLFYIPLILLFIPIILFFIHAIPIKYWFPWFEKGCWKKFQINKINTYEKLWEDIFGTIPHISAFYKKERILYYIILNILLVSLVSPFIILLIYNKQYLLSLISFLILGESLFLMNYFRDRELIKNPADEVSEFFHDWGRR